MEIFQPSFRGKNLGVRKDTNGKFIEMCGSQALIFVPVSVLPNVTYCIKLEMAKRNGNGILYCNIYGNPSYDFPQIKFCCDSTDWYLYNFNIKTLDFPKLVPMVFRIWRNPGGTGSLFIRKIIVELVENNTVCFISKIAVENSKNPSLFVPISSSSNSPIVPPPIPNTINSKTTEIATLQNTTITKNTKYIKYFDKNLNSHRVLYLPINNREIRQTGMEDAFLKNGFNLCSFDFYTCYRNEGIDTASQLLKSVAKFFNPDWIHMQLQDTHTFSPQTISDIKQICPSAFITNWTGDIRNEAISYFVDISKVVDLSLISSIGQLEMYRNAGCKNVEYWQIGYDPEKFYPLDENLKDKTINDVVFCANHNPTYFYKGELIRKEIINLLEKNIGNAFSLYGMYWPDNLKCCKGHLLYFEQNIVYNSAKVVISINNFNNVEMYFSARQLIAMASGTPVVSHYIPGMEKYFTHMENILWFKTPEECLQLVNYCLANPEISKKIGKAGAEVVKNKHTYYKRVEELSKRLNFLDTEPKMSIVLGTYNRLETLKNVINSIVLSIGPISYEIIINDAGSTDGTIKYLDNLSKFDNHIKPIFSGNRTNITEAYNKSFRQVRGKFVTWLSDDTIPIDNSLEKMYNLMLDSKLYDVGAFSYRNNINEKYWIPKIGSFLCPVIACVSKETLKKLNYWNTDYPQYGQDIEFNARCLRMGGKILSTDNLNIDHLNCLNGLKQQNITEYNKECYGQKFHIIYNERYGILSSSQYPMFLFINNIQNKQKLIKLIKIMYSYYKNAYFFISNNESYEFVVKQLPFVKLLKNEQCDLIFSINENGIESKNTNGTNVSLDFIKKIINDISTSNFDIEIVDLNLNYVKIFNENLVSKRVLYLPINNREIRQTGMEDAFLKNGFNLCSFDFYTCYRNEGIDTASQLLKSVAKFFNPDWIHMQLQDTHTFSPQTISDIKQICPSAFITNWTGDIRNEAISYFVDISKVVDLSLISSIGQLEMYRNAGCKNVEYWQIGYDPEKFYPLDENLKDKTINDVVFCANHNPTYFYKGELIRKEIINLLEKNIGNAFSLYGMYWPDNLKCCKGHLLYFEQNIVYNSAKVVISINNFNNVEMYFSARQLIAMASGTPVVSHYIPGMEKYFTHMENILWFKTPEECLQLVNYCLANPEISKKIGKAGAEVVKNKHTYYKRVEELSKRLNFI
ncbi:MAG: glycosyltransferase [Patescibacteria group bacterium]